MNSRISLALVLLLISCASLRTEVRHGDGYDRFRHRDVPVYFIPGLNESYTSWNDSRSAYESATILFVRGALTGEAFARQTGARWRTGQSHVRASHEVSDWERWEVAVLILYWHELQPRPGPASVRSFEFGVGVYERGFTFHDTIEPIRVFRVDLTGTPDVIGLSAQDFFKKARLVGVRFTGEVH